MDGKTGRVEMGLYTGGAHRAVVAVVMSVVIGGGAGTARAIADETTQGRAIVVTQSAGELASGGGGSPDPAHQRAAAGRTRTSAHHRVDCRTALPALADRGPARPTRPAATGVRAIN